MVFYILEVCQRLLFLAACSGGMLVALGLARWVSEFPQQQRHQKKRKAFNGSGRTLGASSSAEERARITKGRFQQATKARREGDRLVKVKREVEKRARAVLAAEKRASAQLVAPRGSPPQSFANDLSDLPEELRPESTKHFFVCGATKFIALPPLFRLDDASAILHQIALEFMPIIHKRGFKIRSVSEMCCCGDGLEYELGGERRSVPAGEAVVGNDHDTVAGYNGKLFDNHGKAEYVIHLRLRKVKDHNQFMDYEEIVDTMAHELSHCVHEDHGPEFWDLMEEILEDRAKIVEDFQNGRLAPHDAAKLSKEQFGGFDIYQSVSGQMRDYHNRRP